MAAGFSITIGAVDQASAKLDSINKQIQKIRAPVDRLHASFAKLAQNSGMAALTKSFGDLGRYAFSAFESIARIVAPLGAITGALTAAGLARLVTDWGDFGQKLGFTAQRLGISAGKLQELQGAARLAGSSSDALTGGLRSLGDTLHNAIGGRAPEAVVLFSALHIAIRDKVTGAARSAIDVLPELANKLAKIKDPVLRSKVATIALGASIDDLMPLLLGGAEGMGKFIEASRRLGVIDERGLAIANKLAEAKEKVTIAVERLTASIAEKLAPILTPLLNRFGDWIAANREWIALRAGEEFRKLAIEVLAFGAGVQKVVDFLGGWQKAAEDLMLFMVGKWALGILGSISQIALALDLVIAKLGIIGGSTLVPLAAPIAAAALVYGTVDNFRHPEAFIDPSKWKADPNARSDEMGLPRHLRDTSVELPVSQRGDTSVELPVSRPPSPSPVTGQIDVNVRVDAPPGTSVRTETSGDAFRGAPKVGHAMTDYSNP